MTSMPVGQTTQVLPRAEKFSATFLDEPIKKLKTSFLVKCRRFATPFVHRHAHVRVARLVDPPRDVFDCRCGDRKLYSKNGAELPYQRFLRDEGSITLDKIFADKTGGS